MRSEKEIRERMNMWENSAEMEHNPVKATAKVVELEWVLSGDE
jgi:hypothetical protein